MIYAKKGNVVRSIYLLVSLIYWVVTFGGRFFGAKKIILCYHGITDLEAKNFREQMDVVKHRVISNNNNFKENVLFSKPSVVVTFDDAFENLISNVLPVINNLNIPIAIYVVTNSMGSTPIWLNNTKHKDENERLMSQQQVINMSSNQLIEIGSHTHNHYRLTNLSMPDVKKEIIESISTLENIIGKKVLSLAFPHGAHTKEIDKTALSFGLKQLLTLDEKMCVLGADDGIFGRFSMEPSVWNVEFLLTVDGAYSWLYYFRNFIRYIKKIGY